MRDIEYKGSIGARREINTHDEDPGQGWWFKGLIFVAAILMTLANVGYQRSKALEYAVVGNPSLGELVQRDKEQELSDLEEHYKYNSYETHSDKDRARLTAIITGGE